MKYVKYVMAIRVINFSEIFRFIVSSVESLLLPKDIAIQCKMSSNRLTTDACLHLVENVGCPKENPDFLLNANTQLILLPDLYIFLFPIL